MKAIIPILLLALTMIPAEAKKNNNANKIRKANAKERVEDRKEAQQKAKEQSAVEGLLTKKDDNKDLSLSREEYLKGEANAEAANKKFDEFNLNKDRVLSKSEILKMLGF